MSDKMTDKFKENVNKIMGGYLKKLFSQKDRKYLKRQVLESFTDEVLDADFDEKRPGHSLLSEIHDRMEERTREFKKSKGGLTSTKTKAVKELIESANAPTSVSDLEGKINRVGALRSEMATLLNGIAGFISISARRIAPKYSPQALAGSFAEEVAEDKVATAFERAATKAKETKETKAKEVKEAKAKEVKEVKVVDVVALNEAMMREPPSLPQAFQPIPTPQEAKTRLAVPVITH